MATSGSYNYNQTAIQIITEALELIGAYEPGESISSNDSLSCLRSLNLMVKDWQRRGVGLWKNQNAALFLEYNKSEYDIGPTGDHATDSWIKTEVATAASSGASSLVVDSVTNATDTFDRDGIVTSTTPAASGSITLSGTLVNNSIATLPSQREILIYSDGNDSGVSFAVTGTDNFGESVSETITGPNTTTVYSTETYRKISSITISGAGTGNIEIGCVGNHVGIELDDGTLQWTWIGAALSTTLTLVDSLTDDVAVDNHVYIYEDKLQRPLEISDTRVCLSDGTDRPIDLATRNEYNMLSDKTTRGTINTVYFDLQRDNAKMFVWQNCDDVQEYLKFTARIPIEDFDATTNEPDLPQDALLALAWNLATIVAPKFGIVPTSTFELKALELFEELKNSNREFGSIYIVPNKRR